MTLVMSLFMISLQFEPFRFLKTGCYYSCLAVRSDKKSLNQETGLGNRGFLKVLNDTKFRTFGCPLFPKPVSWMGSKKRTFNQIEISFF